MEVASSFNVMFWGMVGIQILGFFSASFARAATNKTYQSLCQQLFFASFIGVAVSTMGCLAVGSLWWVIHAGMLGWMAIAVTWDAGHSAAGAAR